MNSGTVVDLFEPDEFDAMTMDLKNDAFNVGMSETAVQLREFFYQVTPSFGFFNIQNDSFRLAARPNESSRDSFVFTGGEKVSRDLPVASVVAQLHEYRLVHGMERNLHGSSGGCLSRDGRFEVN